MKPLRVLVCEDHDDDYQLLVRELTRVGYRVTARRIDSSRELRDAIVAETWDIILADWSMPGFTATEALAILRELEQDTPFVIVSGLVGEEAVAEALRTGARDFVPKAKLARIGVVVERELGEAITRRERIRMQEQLMVSDRMASLGSLAAGVAHEINNPLAAIISNLDLALEILAEGSVREMVDDARRGAERVKNIVRDLSLFSRSGDERNAPVDLLPIMEASLRLAGSAIRHRAKLVKHFTPVGDVHGSEARLGQVFLNLIINAVELLPAGRANENEIRVKIDSAGAHARIAITDTGPGLEPEALKRVFTPFHMAKVQQMGSGLGLSVCHRIVTSLGGEIQVDSQPGATTFTVLLPFSDAPVEAPIVARTLTLRTRRGRVLVIDDDVMVGKAVQRALEGEHDTVYVDRGADALARIRSGEHFDVILCDVMMPELTGMDLHEELSTLAPEHARTMIFLTGGVFAERARIFLDGVANERIEKPFAAMQLRSVINDRVR